MNSQDELMGMVATEAVESIAEAEHIKRRLELAGQKQRLIDELRSRDERIRLLESALRRWLDADDAISAIDARDAAEALLAVIGKGAP